jgi:hypothetical protein
VKLELWTYFSEQFRATQSLVQENNAKRNEHQGYSDLDVACGHVSGNNLAENCAESGQQHER